MKTYRIDTDRAYDVILGDTLLKDTGKLVRQITEPCCACVITDSNVNTYHAQLVMSSLMEHGFQTSKVVFPAGEHAKNLTTYANIVSALGEEGICRSDLLIALGGGVVGDMTGFVASTYLRGIPYVQIPTTLLAQLDSAIGGKTSINLQGAKNLVGSYWQPSLVICDLQVLSSLPETRILDGFGEVLKCAAVCDWSLTEHLLSGRLEYLISRCLSLKKSFLEVDERETGILQLLNFGHTVGHAIEKLSVYGTSHGHAIALGILVESQAAYQLGLTGFNLTEPLLEVLQQLHIDTRIHWSAEEIYQLALNVKKISQSSITVIVPNALGKCELQKLPLVRLEEFIQAGLAGRSI